jgi:NDP-sugar pyrophosphorylase family protein
MAGAHVRSAALATLAVRERPSSRQLLFDDRGQLCGRRRGHGVADEIARSSKMLNPLAFSGIHVISPQLLRMVPEEGVFSIIDTYLRLAADGEKIAAFRADDYYWRDVGKPDQLRQAALDLDRNLVSGTLR